MAPATEPEYVPARKACTQNAIVRAARWLCPTQAGQSGNPLYSGNKTLKSAAAGAVFATLGYICNALGRPGMGTAVLRAPLTDLVEASRQPSIIYLSEDATITALAPFSWLTSIEPLICMPFVASASKMVPHTVSAGLCLLRVGQRLRCIVSNGVSANIADLAPKLIDGKIDLSVILFECL